MIVYILGVQQSLTKRSNAMNFGVRVTLGQRRVGGFLCLGKYELNHEPLMFYFIPKGSYC